MSHGAQPRRAAAAWPPPREPSPQARGSTGGNDATGDLGFVVREVTALRLASGPCAQGHGRGDPRIGGASGGARGPDDDRCGSQCAVGSGTRKRGQSESPGARARPAVLVRTGRGARELRWSDGSSGGTADMGGGASGLDFKPTANWTRGGGVGLEPRPDVAHGGERVGQDDGAPRVRLLGLGSRPVPLPPRRQRLQGEDRDAAQHRVCRAGPGRVRQSGAHDGRRRSQRGQRPETAPAATRGPSGRTPPSSGRGRWTRSSGGAGRATPGRPLPRPVRTRFRWSVRNRS